jgi:hypothetical protein
MFQMSAPTMHKGLRYLLVTSNDVNEANELLEKNVAGWQNRNNTSKMNFLRDNFVFNIGARFTLESDDDKIAKEDYFATLQYLISEASDFGIETVVKQESKMEACAV